MKTSSFMIISSLIFILKAQQFVYRSEPQYLGELQGTSQLIKTGEVLYTKPQISQTQEIVSAPEVSRTLITQPIITQKLVTQPIIKQQVVQTPIVRQVQVSRPVYTENEVRTPIVDSKSNTRTIPIMVPGKKIFRESTIQPVQQVIEEKLNVIKGETRVVNNEPIVKPVETTEEVLTKEFQAPAKQVFYQPIYEKKVINNKEEIQLIPGQDKTISLNSIQKEPYVKEQYRTETITRPGREIIRESVIQPVLNRENIDLKIVRGDDKEVMMDAIYEKPVQNQELRTQVVNIPGKETITQPVYQEYYQQNDIHHFQNPVLQGVQFNRQYPIPVPVMEFVPTVRHIPIPVPSRDKAPTEELIIKEVDIEGRRKNRGGKYGENKDDKKGFGFYPLKEASWIQEGLDKALNKDQKQ